MDLHDAVAAGDYGRALVLAIAAWREHRTVALADLVDAISQRGTTPAPPTGRALHAWWIERAFARQPHELGALLATFRTRAECTDTTWEEIRVRWAGRSGTPALEPFDDPYPPAYWLRNFHERAAALLEWPDDPRLTAVFVDAIARPMPQWLDRRAQAAMRAFAERLIAMADLRALPPLQRIVAEPRGAQNQRELQVATAMTARDALHRVRPPLDTRPDVGALAALIAPPQPPPAPAVDIDALWREVAANPDDIGTRAILGDALVLAGDPRGDIIVLQCSGRAAGRPMRGTRRDGHDGRAKTLLRREWHRWLGDAALVVVRTASEFHCGMLEVAGIGQQSTPPWAWDKLRGHRELCAVHTIRPRWIKPAQYAAFVAALPRDPRHLVVHDPAVFAELAKVRPRFSTKVLELCRDVITWAPPNLPRGWGRIHNRPLLEAFQQAATLLPDVADLRFGAPWLRDAAFELAGTLLPELPRLFPALQRIELHQQLLDALGNAALAGVARDHPLVDVVS